MLYVNNFSELARHAGHDTTVTLSGDSIVAVGEDEVMSTSRTTRRVRATFAARRSSSINAAVVCRDCSAVLLDFDNVPEKGQIAYAVDQLGATEVFPNRDWAVAHFREMLDGGAENLCIFTVRVPCDGMTWDQLADMAAVAGPPSGVLRFNLADEMTDDDNLLTQGKD